MSVKPELRLAAPLLLLALTACGGDKPSSQGSAGGEVLPGSASDAMLPTDQIKSQPAVASGAEAVALASDKPGDKSGDKAEPKKKERHSRAPSNTGASIGASNGASTGASTGAKPGGV
jgi:hypothetical protein